MNSGKHMKSSKYVKSEDRFAAQLSAELDRFKRTFRQNS